MSLPSSFSICFMMYKEMESRKGYSFAKYFVGFFTLNLFFVGAKANCNEKCDALAFYYIWEGSNLHRISSLFSTTVDKTVQYNPRILNPDNIKANDTLNMPFSCGCINNEFLGHQFVYVVRRDDNFKIIAERYYSNLTTVEMIVRHNDYSSESAPTVNESLNIVVNCSCGSRRISKKYGLLMTYPLHPGKNLTVLSNEFGISERLLQDYNPVVDFGSGKGLVFIPAKDQNGDYPQLKSSSKGMAGGAIAGISVVAVVGVSALALCIYSVFHRRNKAMEGSYHEDQITYGPGEKISEFGPLVAIPSSKANIIMDKSVEFTFAELAIATNNFNLACKIGEGGFGSVFYGELRGKRAAIKKMDMEATKEFLAELKVLTQVHHVNLVHLIGYCVQGALFLIYEYIENGNLNQHLHKEELEPSPWSTRLQIALDSARGLQYIHEHIVPVYIHRDIKPANILIDAKFRAKVADFGLAKLSEVRITSSRSSSLKSSFQTRLVGTLGYVPPEYARYGVLSPKIDVYAFGVVLFELISAKQAILKTNETEIKESIGLIDVFKEAFKQPDPIEYLRKLVDPRLGDNYPLNLVIKVAHLAKACTDENPQLRPTMRSVVAALSSLAEPWVAESSKR